MKVSLILLFLPLMAFGRHYPEDKTYSTVDRGYTQYGAPSLYNTGTYGLTFDDGPHPIRTPKILDTLKKYQVKATFFTVTSQITEKTFPIVKRILDEGHILASHGRYHDNSNTIDKATWKSRVKQSFVDLAKWYKKAGHPFAKFYYRFPYAAYGERKDYHHMNILKDISDELMQENCIHFTFWDIDSGDWIPGMSGMDVLNNFKANQEGGDFISYKTIRTNGRASQVKVKKYIGAPLGGGVVLQHDIQQSSVEGTEYFLKYAKDFGLRIVRLDEIEEFRVTRDCHL
jgi:peptidoglycan/xylan/chitin deacetylase (PgdA/CDA1 family)